MWLYPYSHVKSTHWLKSGSLCKKGNTKYNRQGCVRSLNLDTRNKWKEIRKITSDSPPPSTDKSTPALLHCSLAECCAPWGCYCPHSECCGCGYGYILSNWLLNNQEIKSRWEFRLFHLLYFRLLGKMIGSDKDTSEAEDIIQNTCSCLCCLIMLVTIQQNWFGFNDYYFNTLGKKYICISSEVFVRWKVLLMTIFFNSLVVFCPIQRTCSNVGCKQSCRD